MRASNHLTANSDDKPQWTTSGASQRTREGSTERDNYLMLKSGVNVGAWRLRASNHLTANSDDKPQWTTSGA
ncbi:hypothetical protein Q6280_28725, partial [Klebsiella pneumoniae]|uniref:hypothetical protein n=1 Tax=Klebsiella pneumoniae TaxID=573 RepID=UPI002731942F